MYRRTLQLLETLLNPTLRKLYSMYTSQDMFVHKSQSVPINFWRSQTVT